MLFGLADEIPLWVATDGLRLGLPFCRVVLGGESGPQLLWATEPPGEGSRAELIFDSVMRRDDPFEAFARAAQCLSRAYAYRQIHGIASFAGLNAVVHLSRPAAEDGSGRSAAAERLWELLALPAEDGTNSQNSLPSPWISQMEWPGALMPFQVEAYARCWRWTVCCWRMTWVWARPCRRWRRCGFCGRGVRPGRAWWWRRPAC